MPGDVRRDHLGVRTAGQRNARTGPRRGQRAPVVRAQLDHPQPVVLGRGRQTQLDGPAVQLPRQCGRQGRRRVDDDQVTGMQDARQVAEPRVPQVAAGARRDQHRDVVAAQPALLGRLAGLDDRHGVQLGHGAATIRSCDL